MKVEAAKWTSIDTEASYTEKRFGAYIIVCPFRSDIFIQSLILWQKFDTKNSFNLIHL